MLLNCDVGETLVHPLDYKEVKPVNPKENQSWISIGGTDNEAQALILWTPDAKSRLIRKDPDAGKVWRLEEKGMTEDEMVGWHHRPDGHEFEQVLRDDEGQRSLVCWSPWSRKKSDMTEWLSNNKCVHILWKYVSISNWKGIQITTILPVFRRFEGGYHNLPLI